MKECATIEKELKKFIHDFKALHINVFLYYCIKRFGSKDFCELAVDVIYDLVNRRKLFFCGNGYIREEKFLKISDEIINHNKCFLALIDLTKSGNNNGFYIEEASPCSLPAYIGDELLNIFTIDDNNKNSIFHSFTLEYDFYCAVLNPYDDINNYYNPHIDQFYFIDDECNITDIVENRK